MIDTKLIRALTDRYQTTQENIIREYFQHLFLSHLYRQKDADRLLFKGGTALRIIWQSPRFSEDLDFTGIHTPNQAKPEPKRLGRVETDLGRKDFEKSFLKTCPKSGQVPSSVKSSAKCSRFHGEGTIHAIESLLEKTLAGIEKEGINVKIDEAKKTSGGYLSILQFEGGGNRGEVQLEVSLRTPGQARGDTALIPSAFIPAFTLIHLQEKKLVHEKVTALLGRAKPRDFYDLYFILRSRLAFKEIFQKDKALKPELLEALNKTKLDAKSELKRFLPASQHGLLKNFKSVLTAEIERNLPAS